MKQNANNFNAKAKKRNLKRFNNPKFNNCISCGATIFRFKVLKSKLLPLILIYLTPTDLLERSSFAFIVDVDRLISPIPSFARIRHTDINSINDYVALLRSLIVVVFGFDLVPLRVFKNFHLIKHDNFYPRAFTA